ncbi:MAG: OpgC domain-containing protein [Pseudomonadota bacterium]
MPTDMPFPPGAAAPSAPKAPAAPQAQPAARVRDLRLDFFRGIAMFIILIAHTPGNAWTRWIPARWGFSDATEIFVFCSGMASAIAFGATYARKGWWLGTARTIFRIWQVYWAHIGLFFVIAFGLAALDLYGNFEKVYIGTLALNPFFENTPQQLVGLMTLTYVPNYFDILPMYLVILAMMPLVMLLARIDVRAVFVFCGAMWLAANLDWIWLPAAPFDPGREWFFNPFGWQLIFFTGFAFMAGWLPAPPRSRWLLLAAIAFVVLSMPVGSPRMVDILKVVWPALAEWSMQIFPDYIRPYRVKTDFGILRYIHFLSLAYIAWYAVGEGGVRLLPKGDGPLARTWEMLLAAIVKVGQQSLAIFVFSMAYARVLGFVLDHIGRTPATWVLINFTGFVTLIGVAYAVGWIKTHPWRSKRA